MKSFITLRPDFSKFLNFKRHCANLCPILYGFESVMINNCAGKILERQNSTLVDGYVHLNKCIC